MQYQSINQSIDQSITLGEELCKLEKLAEPQSRSQAPPRSAFRNVATLSKLSGLTLKRRAPETRSLNMAAAVYSGKAKGKLRGLITKPDQRVGCLVRPEGMQ